MAQTNQASIRSADAQIIAGIKKNMQNSPPMIFGGVTYTPTTLIALFQSEIDGLNACVSVRGQWIATVQAAKILAKKMKVVKTGLLEMARQAADNSPDILAEYGFTPRKSTATTDPVTKVVAAEKRRATRKARHTMGRVQKLAVVGTVDSPIVIPTEPKVE